MKAVFQKIKAKSRKVSLRTGYESYSENEYGKTARITDQSYRERLTSWQIPAIQAHFGDLTDKVFLDIGAGDIVQATSWRKWDTKTFLPVIKTVFEFRTQENHWQHAGFSAICNHVVR